MVNCRPEIMKIHTKKERGQNSLSVFEVLGYRTTK